MIYYLRKGERTTASAETISKIATVLRTTADYLIGQSDESGISIPSASKAIQVLADLAVQLPEPRQFELINMANALIALERQEGLYSLPPKAVTLLFQLEERFAEKEDSDAFLALVDKLLTDDADGHES